jgi:YHS domain-containing protein
VHAPPGYDGDHHGHEVTGASLLVLNVVALAAFAVLFGLTIQRGATDPVCRMRVDRSKSLRAEHADRSYHLCSEHSLRAFEAEPERYAGPRRELSAATQVP